MSREDYSKALKMGHKDYQQRMLQGEKPTLLVLDDIIPPKEQYREVSLGTVQIPIDRIVGTKTVNRSNSFAGNYMPIMDEKSEFASKWSALSTSHEEEGLRDPIKAYEYMNYFYVEEGNKRVSVMKYFEAVSIPGTVIRIIPKRTEEKENKIYYEFLGFYDKAPINYIWFSKEGSFAQLQEAVGKGPDEKWSDDDLLKFSAVYARFMTEYKAKGGAKLKITPGDAFLAFIKIYDYKDIDDKTTNELKELISKCYEEFELLQEENDINLKMEPVEKKSLLSILNPFSAPRLKIAFIYEKTPGTSAWTYAHELGRLHLEQVFPDEVKTVAYSDGTIDNIDSLIDAAIQEGCNLIITTSPPFVQASVKAAIDNPNVRILNCSLNTSHRYIRTYYSRMYEAKFLTGAIAGAMAENDKVAYIAEYPIYGTIANINAFALGAKMVNPRIKIYLEWFSKKDTDIENRIKEIHPSCVSGREMVIPEEATRYFGLYHVIDGQVRNIAMPIYHWGKFYERLIRTIMDGQWRYDDDSSTKKAINYWWGISAGVIDVICSQYLPLGTKRLVDLLKTTICTEQFNPFSGVLYSQEGMVNSDPASSLSPEEIMTMDWLCENIIGSIPKINELHENAEPVIKQQGVMKEEG